MEDNGMTVRQVLEITRDVLGGICVPVNLTQQIAEPIRRCAENIQLCLDAMAQEPTETKEVSADE